MRLAKTTAVIACLAAAALGGCGSSDDKGKPIPAAARAELDKRLASVQNRFEFGDGACADIAKDKDGVQKTIDGLPDDTDSDVKSALQDGFDHLFELTDEQCDEKKGQNTDTGTTESTPAPTPTETTPSETTPSETTPTTPSETTPKKPKDNNSTGNGNGNGNGGGGFDDQGGTGGGGVQAPGELP